MAELSCLHWGGGLRSLPRYPAAQGLFRERVGWTTALAWTLAPEENCALCHQHGDRGLRRQLTVVWGLGVLACVAAYVVWYLWTSTCPFTWRDVYVT